MDRLESWKEIAAYLKRDVRTVQRWEASEELPVHRHQHKKRGSVYAYPAELDAWRDSRRAELFTAPEADAAAEPVGEFADPAAEQRRLFPWRWPAVALILVVAAVAVLWARGSSPTPAVETHSVAADAPRVLGEALRDGGALDRIPIDGDADAIALTPDGATLYVSLCGDDAAGLRSIDVRSRTVKWSITGVSGCGPLIVHPDGARVIMADQTEVVVVDALTRAVRRIPTPAARVIDLALTPDGRTLYAAAVFQGLLAIDTDTWRVQTLNRLPCPVHLALTPAADRLFVSYQCSGPGGTRGHDSIDVIETASHTSLGAITGLPNVGGDVAVTPDGAQVWVDGHDACHSAYYDHAGCPKGHGAIVNVIRTADRMLLRSLRVGPAHEFNTTISFTNDGSRAVVSRSHVTVVSTTSLAEVESSPLAFQGKVAFSRDGRVAYAILKGEKAIAVLPIAGHPAPPPGLTARWAFDGTGTDLAGGNDFSPVNSFAFAPGRIGLAANLKDATAVRLPSPTNLDIDRGQLTAMSWVKTAPDGVPSPPMTVMEYAAAYANGTHGWIVMAEADGHTSVCMGRFEGRRCAPERSVLVRGATRLSPERWHHLAITRTADTLTLYVDGRVDGVAQVAGTGAVMSTSWLRLGSDEAGMFPLAGLLDEVEIYSRALTPEEISTRGK